MKLRFFDFEVLPKWWMCTFGDLPENQKFDETIKDTFEVVSSDQPNARDRLLELMKEDGVVVAGYNIKGYDLIIANTIYNGFAPEDVFKVNEIIINPSKAWETKEHMRMAPFAKKRLTGCVYQDLFDDNNGSLKEKEAILGLNILESSVDFLKEDLTDKDKDELIYYCKHDVYAAMYYFVKIMAGYVANKLVIGKKFNIPEKECYMCTNAKLVAKALGAVRTTFDDTEKVEIFLPSKIRQYCYDNLPSGILDKIRTSTESFSVKLFGDKVDFGNGGIHSVYDTDLYVESDDEYVLVNVDAASYYPSMLIQFESLSRAVHNPSVFRDIFDERIRLKHKPDRTPEEDDFQLANKLVLNTTFGASGNKYLDLYDPYMCTRCCRLGQIYLAALACKLTTKINSCRVIQTNTDGILVYVKRKDLPTVRELMAEWTYVSGINMEEDVVDKIWQRDVNNYLLIKEGGKIKRKGLWLMETWTKPGYFLISPLTGYVSAKAAIEWLVNGTDIVETVFHNHDIFDFAITCKKGPSFRGVVQKFADGSEQELFKCNRVIASKDSSLGMLYKMKMYKGNLSYYKMPNIPEHCKVINEDLSTYDFDELRKEIDFMYYIERAAELVNRPFKQLLDRNIIAIDKFSYN